MALFVPSTSAYDREKRSKALSKEFFKKAGIFIRDRVKQHRGNKKVWFSMMARFSKVRQVDRVLVKEYSEKPIHLEGMLTWEHCPRKKWVKLIHRGMETLVYDDHGKLVHKHSIINFGEDGIEKFC